MVSGGRCSRTTSGNVRRNYRSWSRARRHSPCPAPDSTDDASAAAADALDLLVQRSVFLAERSFGSLRFFSFGTSPARGWRWPTGAGIVGWTVGWPEFFGTDEDPPWAARQARRPEPPAPSTKLFSASRFSRFGLFYRVRSGTSMAAQLRRPWRGAVLHLPQIGHGTKQPHPRRHQHARRSRALRRFRRCDCPLLPAALPSSRPAHRPITALADRGEHRRNNRRYDSAFRV